MPSKELGDIYAYPNNNLQVHLLCIIDAHMQNLLHVIIYNHKELKNNILIKILYLTVKLYILVSSYKGLKAREPVARSDNASHTMSLEYHGLDFGGWLVAREEMHLKASRGTKCFHRQGRKTCPSHSDPGISPKPRRSQVVETTSWYVLKPRPRMCLVYSENHDSQLNVPSNC